uniref:Uncharacterized protein n=1 Tax=Glossina palpalis gambiensis TaxID=67801 RepID=A0A1B0BMI9_9MUSC
MYVLRRVAIITTWRTQLHCKEPSKETNIHGLNVATITTTITTTTIITTKILSKQYSVSARPRQS